MSGSGARKFLTGGRDDVGHDAGDVVVAAAVDGKLDKAGGRSTCSMDSAGADSCNPSEHSR
jgi:hypothetical protein